MAMLRVLSSASLTSLSSPSGGGSDVRSMMSSLEPESDRKVEFPADDGDRAPASPSGPSPSPSLLPLRLPLLLLPSSVLEAAVRTTELED